MPVDGQSNLVGSGFGDRVDHDRRAAGDLGNRRVAHVPDEAVQALADAGSDLLCVRASTIFTPLDLAELLGGKLVLAEGADLVARLVEDREADLLRLVAQQVVDDHTQRAGIAGVDEFAFPFAVHDSALVERVAGLGVPHEEILLVRRRPAAVVDPPVVAEAGVILRLEQMRGLRGKLGSVLPQRADVVENPETAAMGRDDQVGVLDLDVVHRHRRHVQVQAAPLLAVVDRGVNARLGSDEEESLAHRVLADGPGDLILREVAVEAFPGLAVVRRLQQVGRIVVRLAVAGDGEVDGGRVVRRDLDLVDAGEFRQSGRSDIVPRLAAVAGQVDQPVIAACPEDTFLVGRLDEAVDGGEGLLAEVFGQPGRARDLHLVLEVECQVIADLLPGHALVAGAEDHVRRHVDGLGIVRGNEERCLPVEAVLELRRGRAEEDLGPNRTRFGLPGLHVVDREVSGTAIRRPRGQAVDNVGIPGFRDRRARSRRCRCNRSCAAGCRPSVMRSGHCRARRSWAIPVDPVGELVIGVDAIELHAALIGERRPCLAAGQGDLGAAVAGHDHAVGVLRIDPDVLEIVLDSGLENPGFPGVDRAPELVAGDPQFVGILRVGMQVIEIEGPGGDVGVVGDESPGLAHVIGAIEALLGLGVDQGIDPLGDRRPTWSGRCVPSCPRAIPRCG